MAKRQARTKSGVPVLPVRESVHFPGVIHTILIGREMSVKALHRALQGDRELVTLCQKEQGVDDPKANELFETGTLAEVVHVLPLPDGTMRVVLRGICRTRAASVTKRAGSFRSDLCFLEDRPSDPERSMALSRECISQFQACTTLGLQAPPEVIDIVNNLSDLDHLPDLLAHHLPLPAKVKQVFLEQDTVEERLHEMVTILTRERHVLELQAKVRNQVEQELGQSQREYYLREQLKVIQHELGGDDALTDEGQEYKAKLSSSGMPPETLEKAMQEVRRLERTPSSSPEGMIVRNYLDCLVELPWSALSQDQINVRSASETLDRDHYGLNQVKDRILDFLAVRQLSPGLRGPILCFVGPPGVGKTRIGRSIAESLGRRFHRVSLGGVRDEAEIRGHRRTYIGSMPGRILSGLKTCGTRNPVFMLDEVDKMGHDFRGDPTSALLEALDPEQNSAFSDHYVEAPFDLSAVMFIATANLLEEIPAALRDRMEIIRFPSYTEQEKIHIARQYLIPKTIQEHGLGRSRLRFDAPSLQTLIREYTREAGVRSLEREIATVCRKSARLIAEGSAERVEVDRVTLEKMLGRPKFRYGLRWRKDEVGAATGLVYSEFGGDILTIEVSLTPPYADQPQIRLTGSLGDVMKESALAATTYVRANQRRYDPKRELKNDLHVHVPEGAVPKDGPSAGVAILVALVSAFSGRPVRRDVAMTGELTLRGRVLPVGGVREKVLAASRAGIRHVVLPEENSCDLEELPESVRKAITFHFVKSADEALAIALAD